MTRTWTCRIACCLGAVGLLLAAPAAPVLAQSAATTGLTGRVTDPSGAGVPDVTVTVTSMDTGQQRTVKTSGEGAWAVRFLTPGRYTIQFEAPRFKILRREGVSATTAEMVTVDVRLELGALTEEVEVLGEGSMVSTSSATIVRSLDSKELEALPTSARNFTKLLVIEPGVSADLSELLSNDNTSISPSVNETLTTNNSFVFNGIEVTNLLCCSELVNDKRGTIGCSG